MRMKSTTYFVTVFFLISCASCSLIGTPSSPSTRPTPPFPIDEPEPIPLSEISITVTVPVDTPTNADLLIEFLDEVTGWPYNTNTLPLKRSDDGRWHIEFTPPSGSLIRYRYLRQNPSPSVENRTDGTPVNYRTLYVPGAAQIEDIVSAWSDTPYQGSTGRILGRLVEEETGEPLSEMIVSVAGHIIFTDPQGSFRVDGLVPGLHNITAFSPDGAYRPAQQGAIIATDSTTPAQMILQPAKRIQVTFEVAIPGDTIEGTPLRIAGNIQQFGHLFTEYAGGRTNAISQMPTMIAVDPTHHIQIIDLYAGTDLRYKYTIGDSLWNSERDKDGEIFTRQVILPEHDLIIRDAVERWQGKNQGSTSFWLTIPPETPLSDQLSIQFKTTSWLQPLPMWHINDREWLYTLYNLPVDESIAYRYCRNQQCGSADDIQTPGLDSPGRELTPKASDQEVRDTITQWMWWSGYNTTLPFEPPQLAPRGGFETGFELLPKYNTSWDSYIEQGLLEIANSGATAVIFTPSWEVSPNHTIPAILFDPAHTPYRSNLKSQIRIAQQNGLAVLLHPNLNFSKESGELWWQLSLRNDNWWTIWFEQYKAFILTFAQIAQETSVSKIILGGPEVAPALPGGQLFDGSPSEVPAISNSHWNALISEIRSIYSGSIAFEIELSDSLQSVPPFLDAVDEVHIYWHSPLSTDGISSLPDMQVAARSILTNVVLSEPSLSGKPILINIEYPSVHGGTTSCLLSEAGDCVVASAFDQGAFVNPDFQIDLEEQAQAITAVLTEAYYQGAVKGFYVRRYNPIVALQDKSASVNGKPAMQILEFLYPLIKSP
jgi:hypothetical protein